MKEPNQRRNVYAGLALNRAAERRRDANWLADRLTDPRTRILPVWRERNLIRSVEPDAGNPAPIWLDPARARATIVETSDLIFLGVDGEIAHFTLSLSHLEEPEALAFGGPDAELAELHTIGTLLHERDAALLAYSRAITTWHQRHRFCGVCGNPTTSDEGGHVRRCIDDKCGASHFPRTDPAVIMAIEHGNRLLLGRQREWPPGMHSVLAGFVEPGESLEETVAREIFEEAGLTVTDIRYHSSQPWPFPASIMLGFTGRALDDAIRIVEPEFEHIGWYDRRFLANSPEDDRFKLPSHHSIARRLVEDWIAAGD